ncbi:unnamed protein product [Polarella glacialis]|uniref:Uncharacterized protein n=1 Tax=Polarella glacialis TaxID=89957 RepID=A0A813LU00_POLGL|nr:unnamed protein product [Polarella glacialis]
MAAPYYEQEGMENLNFEEAMETNRQLKQMLLLAQQKANEASCNASRRSGSWAPSRSEGRERQATSDYSQQAMASSRESNESSQAINRKRFAQRVAKENAGIATRLSQPGARRIRGKGEDQSLPPGWSRGLGGRMMPPPSQRWTSKPFDAGDWNSR